MQQTTKAPSTRPLTAAARPGLHRRIDSYGFPQGKVALYYYPRADGWNLGGEFSMPKKSHNLSLSAIPSVKDDGDTGKQLSPKLPKTPFRKPWKKNSESYPQPSPFPQTPGGNQGQFREPPMATPGLPRSPSHSKLPPLPLSPVSSPKAQDPGRSFFSNYGASKSSSRIKPAETIRQVQGDVSLHPTGSNESNTSDQPSARRAGSYGDLIQASASGTSSPQGSVEQENAARRRPVGATVRSESNTTNNSTTSSEMKKKNKPKPFAHLLSRTRSIRAESSLTPKPRTPNRFHDIESTDEEQLDALGAKTAPLQHDKDRSFRDMMNTSIPRKPSGDSENDSLGGSSRENGKNSFRDGSGGAFLSNLKTSSSKAADGLGKAGKGFFGKFARGVSGGESEKPLEEENYICSVINLPLVEQTRLTRISKRLEFSRDKTEFWMPSLPWRCIEWVLPYRLGLDSNADLKLNSYLNDKGCEEEGLYRIPGSGPRVKEWQKKFDTGPDILRASELDVDLFSEPDLYDINIIGSMFKAWLRELPDEIFPKTTQARIAEKCMGATETPQMLKDELSKLPPFNYYLLFAITCHLSLLHSFVDRNKMDYRNLCICFQPCLKIDGFCFQFLVCDWKNCWQGCWTEKEALIEENRVLDGHPSLNHNVRTPTPEGRTVSSSHSSKQSISTNDMGTDFTPLSPSGYHESEKQHHKVPQHPAPSLSPISPVSPLSPMRL
ncbi:hypothetical protein FGG08_007211 [Glutinoglossum americanum]|uniref:Rho-GAP domain-containing protein n=1 Tax=Glutinoglossum americanum TaxID=1670608 RepID=A0A9P8HZC0_9PEZI|nr:hypothetical protein FGG08_007211 [Glutinoglossum americanum]